MKCARLLGVLAAVTVFLFTLGCGGEGDTQGWARGKVTIDQRSYEVERVSMELEFGEDGYYNISADPTQDQDQDCIPGLSGGMLLYGPIPASADSAEDLAGERVPVEFSGDGDDANLCFLGMDGLLGAKEAWIKFDSVEGDRVEFTMSGNFDFYDGEGGGDPRSRRAEARATAQITEIWQ